MSVIRRIRRRDGIVQRYHVKHLKRFRKRYAYHRGARYWVRKTELKPAKPEPVPPAPPKIPTLWRLTLTFDFVQRSHYYSIRLQAWGRREELERRRDDFEQDLLMTVEDLLGYDREDWWFVWEMGEGLQEVPYEPDLDGLAEVVLEWNERKSRKAGARGEPECRPGVVRRWRWK